MYDFDKRASGSALADRCRSGSRTGWHSAFNGWTAAILALVLAGCCTRKQTQLEKVARDWCLTIRASQVLPVYPLTEDIQPGDIFLVQVPIDRQQEIYSAKGFLPFDNHLARLNPSNYSQFYDHSFFPEKSTSLLPRDWMRPKDGGQSWQPAPHVAFPSYSFSVRRGAGMNLAVPVQGVPVGLSLMGSDAADGTVSIKQAQSLGVDILSLYRELQAWAQSNGDFLRAFGSDPSALKKNYLRVVNRVYAAGEVDVSLRDTSSQAGGLDVGAPKPVNLLFPELPKDGKTTAETVQKNFTNGWSVLQKMVSDAAAIAKDASGKFLPGGSLKLTAASARTVTLKEEFNPPLILGYTGFDVVIYPGGILGPPIPTHAVLDDTYDFREDLNANPFARIYSQAALASIYKTIVEAPKNSSAKDAATQLDQLAKFVPDRFVRYRVATNSPLVLRATPLTRKDFDKGRMTFAAYQEYRTMLKQSIRALELALIESSEAFDLIQGDQRQETVTPGSPTHATLLKDYNDYLGRNNDVALNNAARRAGVAATFQYLEYISR